jgi:hypothetical protein
VGLQSFEMPPKDLEGLYRDASVHFASGSCHRVEQNSKTSKSPGGAKLENIEITGWKKTRKPRNHRVEQNSKISKSPGGTKSVGKPLPITRRALRNE